MMHLDELAYLVFGSSKLDEWRDYAANILGAMVDDGPGGTLLIKLDEWHYRIQVVPHHEERFLACGWSVVNARSYRAALDHARARGVALTEATFAECRERMVAALFRFTDPAGNSHEICWGKSLDVKSFISPVGVSGFVTGRLGMGHAVLGCDGDYDAALEFYQDVMGLEYSDYFARAPAPGEPLRRVYFFHCRNARQHSLAIGEFQVPQGINHFEVEVQSLDDVGRAMDRLAQSEYKLARTLGRHVNDEVVSFYIVTPSGFLNEYGFGGKVADWTNHQVCEIPVGTYWGHEWQPGVLNPVPTAPAEEDEEIRFRKSIPG